MKYTREHLQEALASLASLRALAGDGDAAQEDLAKIAAALDPEALEELLKELNEAEGDEEEPEEDEDDQPAVTLSLLDPDDAVSASPPDPTDHTEPLVEDILGTVRRLSREARADLLASLSAAEPARALRLTQEWIERWTPLLASTLTEVRLAALLRGMQAVADRLEPGATAPVSRLGDILSGASGGWDHLHPGDAEPAVRLEMIEEAARDLASKRLLTRSAYDALADTARVEAWTLTGAENEHVLATVRDAAVRAIQEGTTLEKFRKDIAGTSVLTPAHAETVFRTSVMQGYSAGQDRLLNDPLVGDLFPYVEYCATHDDRTRKEHLAMETRGLQGGPIYRRDDPTFLLFKPPNGPNCRCTTIPLSVREAARRGIEEAQRWYSTGVAPTRPAWVEMPPWKPTPITLSTEGGWTKYVGPHGGHGWQNAAGDVVYQEEMPGAGHARHSKTSSGHVDRIRESSKRITEAQERISKPKSGRDLEQAFQDRKRAISERRELYDSIDTEEIAPDTLTPLSAVRFKKVGPNEWFEKDMGVAGEDRVRHFFPDGIPGHDDPEKIKAARKQREVFTDALIQNFPYEADEVKRLVVFDIDIGEGEPDDPADLLVVPLAKHPHGDMAVYQLVGDGDPKKLLKEVRKEFGRSIGGHFLASDQGAAELFDMLTASEMQYHVYRHEPEENQPVVKQISGDWAVGYDPMTQKYRMFEVAKLEAQEKRLAERRRPRKKGETTELATDTDSGSTWTRYQGPHGGKGWRSASGEIRYQESMPHDAGTGTSPDHAPSPHPAEQSASSGFLATLKSIAAAPGHLEHALACCARDRIARGVAKLPPKVQTVVNGTYAVVAAGVGVLFTNFKVMQALADRTARKRGMNEEEARQLRGMLSKVDNGTFTVLKFAAIGGIHAAHLPAMVSATVPVGSALYLAYATADDPVATLRAAAELMKETAAAGLAKVGAKGAAKAMMRPAAARAIPTVKPSLEALLSLADGEEASPDHMADLLADALEAHGFSDWYIALLSTALDQVGGLVDAIDLANATYQQHPEHAAAPRDDDAAWVQKYLHGPGDRNDGGVELATTSDEWTKYEGPHGGRGWQNAVSGEVLYQEAHPGGHGRRIEHVEDSVYGQGDAPTFDPKTFKSPYKGQLADRLQLLGEIMKDRAEDAVTENWTDRPQTPEDIEAWGVPSQWDIASWEEEEKEAKAEGREPRPHMTSEERALIRWKISITSPVRDAIETTQEEVYSSLKKRIAALIKTAEEKYGAAKLKELPGYRKLVERTQQSLQNDLVVSYEISKALDAALDDPANDHDAVREIVHAAGEKATKELKSAGTKVLMEFVGLMDELEGRAASDKTVYVTPPSEGASGLPTDDHVRGLTDAVVGYEGVPDVLQPLIHTPDRMDFVSPALGKISHEEYSALGEYTDRAYKPLNELLRAGIPGGKLGSKKYDKLHKTLQGMFARLKPADKPITVYRGLRLGQTQTAVMLRRLKAAYDAKEPVHFAGYSSTTSDPAVAFEYGEGGKSKGAARKKGGAGNDVVFEIAARKGINIGDMSEDSPSGDYSEMELLLDHDTGFRVAAIREVPFEHPETGEIQKRIVVQLVQEVK